MQTKIVFVGGAELWVAATPEEVDGALITSAAEGRRARLETSREGEPAWVAPASVAYFIGIPEPGVAPLEVL